jgi:hypothetical protein
MPEINMIFELGDQKAVNQVAHSLQDRIGKMEMVKEVEATPETSEQFRVLTGMEIAGAIGVTVLIVRSGRELLEEVRRFVQEVKALMAEIHDLKNVYVELGTRRIPIDNLGPEEMEQIAKAP